MGTTTAGEPLPVPIEKKTTRLVPREGPPILAKNQ
jgi:hypothetical protein